ncbi:MAG TPA: hypothetical protein VNT81_10980 [Vicinamibacterales bacterium]|nr:hypothetical protein [Vicinamibacterales bacterium]
MDLIERYVAAVRRHLPKSANPDIVSELADNLRSQAEEREAQLGRALNEDEQAALLKPHGHPWLMASRYMPQQQLIGPALYPYYRQTLAIVVFWVVLPIILVGGAVTALYSDQPGQWLSRMLQSAWNGGIYSVGIVTIIFAVLEHERVKFTALENWNPMRLPKPSTGREIPRSETVIGLVFQLAFLIYWTKVIGLPNFILHGGEAVQYAAAPIWNQLYFPIVATVAVSVGVSLADLIRPWRTTAVSIVDIMVSIASLAIATIVLRESHFVTLLGGAEDAARLAQVEFWVNRSIWWTFAVIGAISAFMALNEMWHLARNRNGAAIRFA